MYPQLKNNRFETAWQGLKRRIRARNFLKKWGKRLLLLLLCLEITGTAIEMSIEGRKGVPFDILSRYFWITRLLITPFITEKTINDIEAKTATKYIGHQAASQYKSQKEDALIGWRPASGISYTSRKAIQGTTDWTWTATTKQGFVVTYSNPAEYIRPKPKNIYRILFLGGSTMQGMGADSFESIPSHFTRLLEEKGYTGFEVINAGVTGFHSTREFLYYLTELYSYEPDLVILYDGWNEVSYGNAEVRRYVENNLPHTELRTSRHIALSNDIEKNRTISVAIRNLFSAIGIQLERFYVRTGTNFFIREGKRAKDGLKTIVKQHLRKARLYSVKQTAFYNPEAVAIYRNNIERFQMLANQYQFKLGVFLQPLIGVDGNNCSNDWALKWVATAPEQQEFIVQVKEFYDYARPMYENLARDVRFSQTCIKDISDVFAEVDESVYIDAGHLNATGNKIVAKKIFDTLTECHLLRNMELWRDMP